MTVPLLEYQAYAQAQAVAPDLVEKSDAVLRRRDGDDTLASIPMNPKLGLSIVFEHVMLLRLSAIEA